MKTSIDMIVRQVINIYKIYREYISYNDDLCSYRIEVKAKYLEGDDSFLSIQLGLLNFGKLVSSSVIKYEEDDKDLFYEYIFERIYYNLLKVDSTYCHIPGKMIISSNVSVNYDDFYNINKLYDEGNFDTIKENLRSKYKQGVIKKLVRKKNNSN